VKVEVGSPYEEGKVPLDAFEKQVNKLNCFVVGKNTILTDVPCLEARG
jgi:hypothetical protein